MKGAAKWIITAVAVIAVGVAIYFFLPKKGTVEESASPLVEVARIDTHTVVRSVDLIGYVSPTRVTAAISRAYGKVTNIRITEGQRVYADQVLVILQPEEVGLDFNPQPVKAPIGGVVSEVMVREGEPVMEGTPVASIVDPSRIEVEVAVAGEYYTDVQTSDNVFLIVNSDTVQARIKSKTPVVDPATRTFGVTLTPLGTSPHLVSGLSVTVRLELDRREGVLAVANSALDDSKAMIVGPDSTIEVRELDLGLSGLERTEVLSGAVKGELVVTFGGKNLIDGQKVRAVEK